MGAVEYVCEVTDDWFWFCHSEKHTVIYNPPQIIDAYFAEKKIVDVPIGGSQDDEYIVKRGDSLSKIAKKYKGISYIDIAKANDISSPYRISVGQRIKIPNGKKKTKKETQYKKIESTNLGSKVYLVAKTKYFENGDNITFKIYEDSKMLVDNGAELPVLKNHSEKTEIKGSVTNKIKKYTEEDTYCSVDDDKYGEVAIEIELRPKKDKPTDENDTDANFEDWKKKFKKLETDNKDKEDKLYLKVFSSKYENLNEKEFLVGDELVVKACSCKTVKVKCTRYGKRTKADGTIYYLNYGPVIWGSKPLKDYSNWDKLLTDNKITKEEKEILIGMSANEGKMDSLHSYDSEVLTMGAMQKTINSSGKGQLARQFQDFKTKYPNKFKEILGACGWSVINNQVFYTQPNNGTKITGKKLKALLREGYNSSNVFKQVESKHLGALVKLSKDDDFMDLQVLDFVQYYRTIMSKTIYGYKVNQYFKSKLGRAVVLDQYVNRPGYTITDLKKALDRFFNSNPLVDKNPTLWGVNHNTYESSIIKDYGNKRRGTDMKNRYKRLKKAFK